MRRSYSRPPRRGTWTASTWPRCGESGTGVSKRQAIGVDLGGTNLRWAVVDEGEGILFHGRQPTPGGTEETVHAVRSAVAACRDQYPEVVGVGVAVPGVVFGDEVTSTNLDWERFPLAQELQIRGLPCIVENDMNAGA